MSYDTSKNKESLAAARGAPPVKSGKPELSEDERANVSVMVEGILDALKKSPGHSVSLWDLRAQIPGAKGDLVGTYGPNKRKKFTHITVFGVSQEFILACHTLNHVWKRANFRYALGASAPKDAPTKGIFIGNDGVKTEVTLKMALDENHANDNPPKYYITTFLDMVITRD